jgi:dephospho-CoA kinase
VEADVILRVGLTGGIASGKSTIARRFAALGCLTIDADHVVARLYRPGEAGHEALVRAYGPSILRADGEIDRERLAGIAFANADEARKLNALIHPLVIAEEKRCIADEESRFPGRDRIVIVEATLLLESGGKQRYDKIVVVDVEPETQIARGIERGMTRDEVMRRMAHQMPREERLRQADYVIGNNGDTRAAEIATHQVYEALRADLAGGIARPADGQAPFK